MAIEFHSAPNPPPPPPEPEAKIDISKRYDAHSSEFVELEQSNGQSIFISRGGIFRICAPGTTVVAEIVTT